jgi:type IV secretory pathway protease TraF
MALVETVVGERRAASNVQADVRGGPYSEVIVNDSGLGRYFEPARYGRLYTSMVKAVTIAATHNSPIAAATATPVLGLHNPSTSGKAVVIQRVSFLTTSGTPAGGQGVLNVLIPTTATTAAQTGSIFSNLLSNFAASPQGSVCRVYNNVALTGIVPTASNEIDLVGGAAAAAAAGNGGPGVVGEDIGGRWIAPPGVMLALMAGSGAGTTWIVNASWSWVEVDWPL